MNKTAPFAPLLPARFWRPDERSRQVRENRATLQEIIMVTIPRRMHLELLSPAELAIREAVIAVERLPADVLLTDAVLSLNHARERVAEYIDGHLPESVFARQIAKAVLDNAAIDPDSDIAVLARQLLRTHEQSTP